MCVCLCVHGCVCYLRETPVSVKLVGSGRMGRPGLQNTGRERESGGEGEDGDQDA